MARTGEFAIGPQPYPARPRWSGDFHRIEASLFSDRKAVERRADDFAQAYIPGHARRRPATRPLADNYVLTQLPEIPSLRIDISLLAE